MSACVAPGTAVFADGCRAACCFLRRAGSVSARDGVQDRWIVASPHCSSSLRRATDGLFIWCQAGTLDFYPFGAAANSIR